jgi:hypothetical protein
MKTILRIIIILLVASAVSAAFFLVVNSGTSTNSSESGQPPGMTSADGQTIPPMERSQGGDNSGSMARGLSGVLSTLMKLTGITLVVLSLQKGLEMLNHRKLTWIQE